MYEVLGKDISMLHVAGTPAGVFDGFLTGFCVSGFVAFEEFFVSLPGTALVLPCWSST